MNYSTHTRAVALAFVVACTLALSHGGTVLSPAMPVLPAADESVTVHIVPHSHDDVGWLKNVDEYYLGLRNDIQHANVSSIITTVVDALIANPDRKFIYVEIAFFERWWAVQTPALQETVRALVKDGRLEFINGGWCMNDEAAPHYSDVVDQMTLGHRFLMKEFSVLPRIGWHIDPFGHSSTQAALFAEMGFDAFFLGRIDYQDKAQRYQDKSMETLWRSQHSLADPTTSEIFTHVLYNHYSAPKGYCWDSIHCSDAPIQDDPNKPGYNVDEMVAGFVDEVRDRMKVYKTNEIMVVFGDDFNYEQAESYFANIDKLIKYANQVSAKTNVTLQYSTPSIYVDAVNSYAQKNSVSFDTKSDDFFPYADREHAYWTGYFTSRPALKGYVRQSAAVYRAAKALNSMARFRAGSGQYDPAALQNIYHSAAALGVAQHHDAVSGTAKQAVTDDYAQRLSLGSDSAEMVINNAVAELLHLAGVDASQLSTRYCARMNESLCDATEEFTKDYLPVVLFNPLATPSKSVVRIPVHDKTIGVLAFDGVTEISSCVVENPVISSDVTRNDASSPYTLVFEADVSALGLATYFLHVGGGHCYEPSVKSADGNAVLKMGDLSATIKDGRLASVTVPAPGKPAVELGLSMDYLEYSASTSSDQSDGAYIFRPASQDAIPVCKGAFTVETVLAEGLVHEAYIACDGAPTQVIRLYPGASHIEIEHRASVSIKTGGHDLIARFKTGLSTTGQFKTDSAGQEMQSRKRDFRETWPLSVNEPVAGNYYPVNEAMSLTDGSEGTTVTLVVDRSVGGASIADGDMEVMLHRRLTKDDGRGVGEPLDEYPYGADIRTTHLLTASPVANDVQHRLLARRLNNPVHVRFAATAYVTPADWAAISQVKPQSFFAGAAAAPDLAPSDPSEDLSAVHFQCLEMLESGQMLVRVHHDLEVGDQGAGPVTLDFGALFVTESSHLLTVDEMNLTAEVSVNDVHRLKWNASSVEPTSSAPSTLGLRGLGATKRLASLSVVVNPMETRTFVLTFSSEATALQELLSATFV